MRARKFGRTGHEVSEIGFGAWAIGASWGEVNDDEALEALHAALDAGVTFLDTADVYGDGHSEKLIARAIGSRSGARPFIATKAGRRLPEQTVAGYSYDNLASYVDRSRRNLEMDTLDLVQLHCPPTDLYYQPQVFESLDRLKAEGRIRDYGVSVERVEEALKAIEFPGVASVQIIFNAFRQRPSELFFERAKAKGVAIIARVPLASGLLSGKFSRETQFAATDHRLFNRNGEAFDVGETFAGVPYEVGLEAVERIRPLVSGDTVMARFALRWILMFDAVTVAIPGARNPAQARSNAAAADLPALSDETMAEISAVYDTLIKPFVHQRW
ncbi:aldo/keto reductase [Kaistia sp. 32K]|uniref:aldo/keto reductase n=1 Tax=Kaistia sp. 32K TaxID=2795690 RepID=UPI0019158F58|nr:aldo/keto reductase [Kaistia sp. 32K]BCP55225.1 aldo/keto reductase [Kaistia sp. 32K]